MAIHEILCFEEIFNRIDRLECELTHSQLMLLWIKRLEVAHCADDCLGLGNLYDSIFDKNCNIKKEYAWLSRLTDTAPLRLTLMGDLPDWMDLREKRQMVRIMKWCFTYNPLERPSVKQLMADSWLSEWLRL